MGQAINAIAKFFLMFILWHWSHFKSFRTGKLTCNEVFSSPFTLCSALFQVFQKLLLYDNNNGHPFLIRSWTKQPSYGMVSFSSWWKEKEERLRVQHEVELHTASYCLRLVIDIQVSQERRWPKWNAVIYAICLSREAVHVCRAGMYSGKNHVNETTTPALQCQLCPSCHEHLGCEDPPWWSSGYGFATADPQVAGCKNAQGPCTYI